MKICCAYALMQTATFLVDIRQAYFHKLANFWSSFSCNGPKIIAGDLNSRLYVRMANEHSIIEPHIIEKKRKHLDADMNRFYLVQLCMEFDLQIANTFMPGTLQDLEIFQEIEYKNTEAIIVLLMNYWIYF